MDVCDHNTMEEVSRSRLEFTRQWMASFLSNSIDQRLEQLKSILSSEKTGKDNIITNLVLDYEVESGCTVLALLLYSFCVDTVPMIARDSKRSGFTSSLLDNLQRNGYLHFSPFDSTRLSLVLGQQQIEAGFEEGHILTLVFNVLERGRLSRPDPVEYLSPEENEFIQFIEQVIRVLLQHSNLTADMKSKFLNQISRSKVWSASNAYVNFYLSLLRLLISNGADICVAEDGSESPIVNAFRLHHVELFLEMILAQTNLMSVTFTDRQGSSIVSAFSTKPVASGIQGGVYTRRLSEGTRAHLLEQFIRRLCQWQEDQKNQLVMNSNFQPNEVPIRDWIQQQLLALKNMNFVATMQHSMHQPSTHVDSPSGASMETYRRDYCRRWIHHLQTTPNCAGTILVEIFPDYRNDSFYDSFDSDFDSTKRRPNPTFLVDSLPVFLQPEFAPYVPRILNMLDESRLSFVDGLVLFGSHSDSHLRDRYPDVFGDILPLLHCDQLINDHDGHRQTVLLQLLETIIQRLSHVLQIYRNGMWKNKHQEHLLQLRLLHGDDPMVVTLHRGRDDGFFHSLACMIKDVPQMLLRLVREVGSSCSVEVFQALWTKILPALENFRKDEFSLRCRLLDQLLESTFLKIHDGSKSIQRFQSFLNHPIFQTIDMFSPFQLYVGHTWQGVTIIEMLHTRVKNGNESARIAHGQAIVDYIVEMESVWTKIRWPAVRKEIEEFLIPDLATIVLTMLSTLPS